MFQCAAVCCSVLQSELQCVAELLIRRYSQKRFYLCTPNGKICEQSVLQHVAVCCCVLKCVAACCGHLCTSNGMICDKRPVKEI